ncbi:MAG: TIGR00282 family metallophosphoesterase [Bacilli bacterium]|jgi:metallophosphoesterase (TIGR00282 family)|nr:TIGR00282 family metallophosphoesterase [Bacilli bacterium]MCH4228571.1 TIGR00282 family metallophosphoesterase [Bacilli bacterium]MCH4277901.1 TIGR00282 family metallophosphoesterase [Bacilli bacterium]MCI2055247.1 TIGR00282 family metallophosphoesterase [Bacilli bacterium]
MRILFLGDVVGKVGRIAVHLCLPRLVNKYHVDFVIVNGENATHGRGLNESHYRYLVNAGADCITLGNHWNGSKDLTDYIDGADELVRPLNLIKYSHGQGSVSFDVNGIEVRVTNMLGQAFMNEVVRQPYECMNELLKDCSPCIHIVDFHADSTSEKAIFAYCFDGRVSAVLGTHTHVQTNDARILEGGTGLVTDVGMCGARDGIIGYEKNSVINKMVFGEKGQFAINDNAPMMVNGALMDFDEESYMCTHIELVNIGVEE